MACSDCVGATATTRTNGIFLLIWGTHKPVSITQTHFLFAIKNVLYSILSLKDAITNVYFVRVIDSMLAETCVYHNSLYMHVYSCYVYIYCSEQTLSRMFAGWLHLASTGRYVTIVLLKVNRTKGKEVGVGGSIYSLYIDNTMNYNLKYPNKFTQRSADFLMKIACEWN